MNSACGEDQSHPELNFLALALSGKKVTWAEDDKSALISQREELFFTSAAVN